MGWAGQELGIQRVGWSGAEKGVELTLQPRFLRTSVLRQGDDAMMTVMFGGKFYVGKRKVRYVASRAGAAARMAARLRYRIGPPPVHYI